MSYERFTKWKPRSEEVRFILHHAIRVIDEYRAQGYALTVRQVYYQLVARDLIPNNQSFYNRLKGVLVKGRMAGFIDWDAIVDRGRTPSMVSDWRTPAELLNAAAEQFRLDRWHGQPCHVEVWCEKDALSSVLEPVCQRYHVRYLANKGYSSVTAMYDAAKRFEKMADEEGRLPVVIYLGDMDPSGMDMTRDINKRLDVMTYRLDIEVLRLALTIEQVREYNPPPNRTKNTDSRSATYRRDYGMECWELDALEPQVLDALVSEAIGEFLDWDTYNERLELEDQGREAIRLAAEEMS